MLKEPQAPITFGESTLGHLLDTREEKKQPSVVSQRDLLKNIMKDT